MPYRAGGPGTSGALSNCVYIYSYYPMQALTAIYLISSVFLPAGAVYVMRQWYAKPEPGWRRAACCVRVRSASVVHMHSQAARG